MLLTPYASYVSYLLLIVIGHMRDFFGKRFRASSYKHLMPHDVRAANLGESAVF
jgi:serine palmitoyltransferase